ncbi:MAG: hypothetical protein O8C62_00730 [Candidatus Methanoperedens sp.]|nr:hypothetical protein [Candidatus Methanoperedens sp.]
MKTIQKTLTGEVLNNQKKPDPITFADLIRLLIKYFLTVTNLQTLLFLLSFLTFGVGDGITSAYMMQIMGITQEVNPVIRFMYVSSGANGVISIKIWFTFLILFLVWRLSWGKNAYWTINGFLFALFIGGIMSIRANLMAANGMTAPSPYSIIFTFLLLTGIFVLIGDLMDKSFSTAKVRQIRVNRASPS